MEIKQELGLFLTAATGIFSALNGSQKRENEPFFKL
jgi:hypothetical protein